MDTKKTNGFMNSEAGPGSALDAIREQLLPCIQCGTCSGSCPNLFAMDITPRQLWRLIMLGDMEAIFHSRTFSLCSSCYACTLRCPQELPLTRIMGNLKQIAARNGITGRKQRFFYQSFLDSVKRHGRVREVELMTMYFWRLKDPRIPFAFLPLGWNLFRRKKVQFEVPAKGENRLGALFRKVAEIEEEA